MRTRRPTHRSGFVSLLGRPNAGKSTLLNRFAGQKLAIVSDKPQTTRTIIQAVWTSPEAQVIFLDTPGIHETGTLINRRMMQSLGEALQERDLILYLMDASRPLERAEERQALRRLERVQTPVFAVLNKVDQVKNKALLLPWIAACKELRKFEEVFPVSALSGEGVEELLAAIVRQLPAGPAYFPPDFVTDQPERFLAAELIREKVLAATRQEVPHSVAVLVDEWDEEDRLLRLSATIYVERRGQKVIVVGAKGAKLKQIATQARRELEKMLNRKLFLTLFVKVQPGWRENAAFLKELDWRAMAGAASPPEPFRADNE